MQWRREHCEASWKTHVTRKQRKQLFLQLAIRNFLVARQFTKRGLTQHFRLQLVSQRRRVASWRKNCPM